jgi:phosphatidylserine decarboxylase
MVKDGIFYALYSLAAGVLLAWLTSVPLLATPFFVFAVFCLYFFRDPDRPIPGGPVAVSPADGKVVAVVAEGPLTRISIFLNIFDVHVNRAPISGSIVNVQYKKGQFLVASKEVASVENEQNVVTIQGQNGIQVTFKQIAGLIARRIVFRKAVGDSVAAGERVGLIKFGSRVDVLLGPEWTVRVVQGQRVQCGSSVLADRK